MHLHSNYAPWNLALCEIVFDFFESTNLGLCSQSLVSCHPVGRDRRRHRQTVQEPPGAVAGGRREGGRGGGGGGREVASVPGSSTSKVCLQVGGVERLCRHSLWKPQHCCDLIETNNIFQFILSLLLCMCSKNFTEFAGGAASSSLGLHAHARIYK